MSDREYPNADNSGALLILPRSDVLKVVSDGLNGWIAKGEGKKYEVTYVELSGDSGRIFFKLRDEAPI